MKLVWVQHSADYSTFDLPDGAHLALWLHSNGYYRLWLMRTAGQVLMETGGFDLVHHFAEGWVAETYPLLALAMLSEEV